MTDTPHNGLPVSGYQPQSEAAVSLVNQNKQIEEILLRRLDVLANCSDIDQRWLAIARTSIEQGFMAINRAILRPVRVSLTEDQP